MDIEAQPFDLRECVEAALDLVTPRAAEKRLDIAYLFEGDVPPRRQRRRDAAAPDPAQPAGQRRQVHRAGRGGADGDAAGRRATATVELTFAVRDTGIGLSRRRHGPAVPVLQAGRLLDHAQVRRHRPGPGDQQAAGRTDGRHACGPRATGPGQGSTFHFTIRAPIARPAAGARAATSSARSRNCSGKRLLVVDDNATNRRMLGAADRPSGACRRATPSRRPRRCAGSTAASPSTSRSSTCTCPRWTA